jgi:beta-glucosidase
VGGLLARDAKAKGSSLLLAPTCNIQRNPLNGRVSKVRLSSWVIV